MRADPGKQSKLPLTSFDEEEDGEERRSVAGLRIEAGAKRGFDYTQGSFLPPFCFQLWPKNIRRSSFPDLSTITLY